jgi:toxin ParE1/3/4
MKYEFHPAALQEYAEAVEFFAQQDKQQDFIDTIESAIFQIVPLDMNHPLIPPQTPQSAQDNKMSPKQL